MMGIIRWLNPAYPLIKLFSPILRRPEKTLAIASKPFASASAALIERNKETVAFQLKGDVEGTIKVEVPYDQNTLEKILALSLVPQVALLSTAYAIPEIQRDLNKVWRASTLGKLKDLPRWNATRNLIGKRINQEAAELVYYRAALAASQKGLTGKTAGTIGARAAGSFIAGVNVAIWVDTAILAATGIFDLLVSEELEDDLGINITPYSPLGDVITSMTSWVGSTLGISNDDIGALAEKVGLDSLVQGSAFLLGDLVFDTENITIESDITMTGKSINLDLDARTFGQTAALALQFGALDSTIGGGWDDPSELMELFLTVFFSLILIQCLRGFLRIFRR